MALGAATVVALVSIVHSSAFQVALGLSDLEAKSLSASLPPRAWEMTEDDLTADLRLDPNVGPAGTFTSPEGGAPNELRLARTDRSVTAGVIVASTRGLLARRAQIVQGSSLPTASVLERDPFVVLLGRRLAAELDLDVASGPVEISFNGIPVHVVGIVVDNPDESAVTTSVVMHPTTAHALDSLPESRTILVSLADASADVVASYMPVALYPQDPGSVSVSYGTAPSKLAASIVSNSSNLINVITALLVVVTAFSIMTTMNAAVIERAREIGVARAIGYSRATVARRFLLEAVLVGAIGSVGGFGIGVVIASAAGALLGWTFILPPVLLALPLFGVTVGAVSGFWPALLASRVEPAELLRS